MRFAMLLAAVTAALLNTHISQADTTYAFDGFVQTTSPFLGDRFTVGMPIHGEFTFDPMTEDVLGEDPSRGNFLAHLGDDGDARRLHSHEFVRGRHCHR